MSTTLRVRYVGKKPSERDNHYGTGIVWEGLGDEQNVPSDAWFGKMDRHPDVWELVAEDEKAGGLADKVRGTEESGAAPDEFDAKTDDELRLMVKTLGGMVHPAAKRATVIQRVRELVAARKAAE